MINLPETDNYLTSIGEVDGDKIYLVINKHTDVVEYKTPMLPQVYTILEQFEEALEFYTKEEVKAEITDNVVTLSKREH